MPSMIFISKLWFPCSILHWVFIPHSWLQTRSGSRLLQAFLKWDRAACSAHCQSPLRLSASDCQDWLANLVSTAAMR